MRVGDLITSISRDGALDILVVTELVGDKIKIWYRYTSEVGGQNGVNYHNEFHFKNSTINVDTLTVYQCDKRLVIDTDFSPEILAKAKEIL